MRTQNYSRAWLCTLWTKKRSWDVIGRSERSVLRDFISRNVRDVEMTSEKRPFAFHGAPPAEMTCPNGQHTWCSFDLILPCSDISMLGGSTPAVRGLLLCEAGSLPSPRILVEVASDRPLARLHGAENHFRLLKTQKVSS